jgi:glycosyltransferase involved in cell wall biosynthesis
MEIIHIILGKANPDRMNGVNKVVYNLATAQANAGKKVSVWGITAHPIHDYPKRNFKTLLFKAHWNPFFIIPELRKSVLIHKKATFHLHGGWVPQFSTLAKFFTKNGITFILTPHGAYNTIAMQRSSWKKKLYFQILERSLLKNSSKIHCVGNTEVDGLQAIFANTKSKVIPYGFETNATVFPLPKNKDFTIGFVGRLDIYTKGLDLLLDAFRKFQKNHPDAKLWLIGEGEGQTFIEDYINENKLVNVILWGKKFGEEKDKLITKMHVFAHPSRNEGLPSAVLEAAAIGIPTVVTKATNMAAYVTQYQAGIGIENEDINALQSALEKLWQTYKDGEAAAYIHGAQKMLSCEFHWPDLVEKFEAMYADGQ